MTRNTDDNDDATLRRNNEFVLAMDCRDNNPNGNPLSPDNKPRIDPVTNEGVITDVRLKRYLRDQLYDDDHGVYIHSEPTEDGNAQTRKELLKQCVDIDHAEAIDETLLDDLLDYAVDIRMFGALLSLDTKSNTFADALAEALPNQFTGPIQFSPARSLHPVQINEESRDLTSVIATEEGKETGGLHLSDYRIRYGFFTFHGVANANSATATNLTATDVERMDTLFWRAIKNQTNTRSKRGQEPRLYLRVEYNEDSYHVGLADLLSESDAGAPSKELRSITDFVVDASLLVNRIEEHADKIHTVHVKVSDLLSVELDGDVHGADALYGALEDAVGEDNVHIIDVYDEYEDTLGNRDTDTDA